MPPTTFGTVLTAMVTPFDSSGAVDYDVAAAVARFLVDSGSDGIVVAGSTGEGTALSDHEKMDLFACVASSVTVPVIAGSTSAGTARSVALTKRVAATGVAGVLATTPAYARPSQSGLAGHLGAVADSTTLPIMLYDIPSRTGRKIAASTTIELAHSHANVRGLKDASGDLPGAAHVKAVLGDALDLYSGDDSLLLAFLAVGATGIVSVAAHWAGPEFVGLVSSAARGDWAAARVFNERLARSCAFESTESAPNPIPAKAAMRSLGFAVGQCRLPLGPAASEVDATAASVIAELRAARG